MRGALYPGQSPGFRVRKPGGCSPLSLAGSVILDKSLIISEVEFLHVEHGLGNTHHWLNRVGLKFKCFCLNNKGRTDLKYECYKENNLTNAVNVLAYIDAGVGGRLSNQRQEKVLNDDTAWEGRLMGPKPGRHAATSYWKVQKQQPLSFKIWLLQPLEGSPSLHVLT